MAALAFSQTAQFLEGFCAYIAPPDSNFAEISAIYKTLAWSTSNRWSNFIIYTDSLVPASGINGQTRIRDLYSNLITACRDYQTEENRWDLLKVPRKTVEEVDMLASTSTHLRGFDSHFLKLVHNPIERRQLLGADNYCFDDIFCYALISSLLYLNLILALELVPL